MLIVVEFEGGDPLSNLTLLDNSFEPRGCSIGDKVYSIINSHEVRLSHLLAGCIAEISLAAQVFTTIIIDSFLNLVLLAATRLEYNCWRKHHPCDFIR